VPEKTEGEKLARVEQKVEGLEGYVENIAKNVNELSSSIQELIKHVGAKGTLPIPVVCTILSVFLVGMGVVSAFMSQRISSEVRPAELRIEFLNQQVQELKMDKNKDREINELRYKVLLLEMVT